MDLYRPLLQADTTANIARAGVGATGISSQPPITHTGGLEFVREKGLPADCTTFDVIIVLWTFDLLPAISQDAALRLWRTCFSPNAALLHMELQTPDPMNPRVPPD